MYARFVGAVGGVMSPPETGPYTSNSEIWPAGHPVLPVMFSRTYRALAAVKLIVTVLLADGSKTRPAEAERSEKEVPFVLPCTARVSVLAPQFAVGSFRMTWLTLTADPRSTCSHCGKALLLLSQ